VPDNDESGLSDLVASAQAGDRAALDALLRSQYDRVYTLAAKLLGDRRDAEDATQEALIAVVRGLHRFDGRSAFPTWVYRVATNTCLDELRRRKRRPVTIELATDHGEPTAAARESAVLERMSVDAALAKLPEDFRVAVVLRDLCDLDYAEIGSALDVPAGTVRSRIARGRARLAELLGGNQTDPGERRTEVP
jgi:RNA polymerase sigma-70 factor (ECF subfamily)